MRGEEEKGPVSVDDRKLKLFSSYLGISLLGDTVSDQVCSREGLLYGIVSLGRSYIKR